MDDAVRTQIIVAAVNAVGPAGDDSAKWMNRVADMAAEITAMTDERSTVSKRVNGIAGAVVYTAVVLGGKKEESSNRFVIRLQAKPGDADSIEEIRTERIENGGLEMAAKAKALVGHRVVIYKDMQPIKSQPGKSTRVLAHMVDLGLVEVEQASNAA